MITGKKLNAKLRPTLGKLTEFYLYARGKGFSHSQIHKFYKLDVVPSKLPAVTKPQVKMQARYGEFLQLGRVFLSK